MSGGGDPSAGRFEGKTHVLPVRVYYEDTDLTGVVYHANYLRFFERGRSDFLRLAGVDHASLLARDDPAAFAVTKMTVEFRRPARIDDALEVTTEFTDARGVRLNVAQQIRRGATPIAAADVEVVCINTEGRVRRPPAELVAALRPWFSRESP
ncbi:MAG TPA: tol-pal system-associated acyl-CoA thioesterase [Caulobacteraceae bacterium]|nr:tol-pal system-associated acyl-CoA thioesterase [Caulobacteraceae bacterium]